MNPHSYRLKGRDFVHQGKIEIDVNERAVFIRTQGCFFVYTKQLLLWGMQCIRKKNTEPIVLHVAEWNKNALLLYKKNGFEITNIEKIR